MNDNYNHRVIYEQAPLHREHGCDVHIRTNNQNPASAKHVRRSAGITQGPTPGDEIEDREGVSEQRQ